MPVRMRTHGQVPMRRQELVRTDTGIQIYVDVLVCNCCCLFSCFWLGMRNQEKYSEMRRISSNLAELVTAVYIFEYLRRRTIRTGDPD